VALDPVCADGPFETDPVAIDRSFGSEPPDVHDSSAADSFDQPEIQRIRDGAVGHYAGAYINDGLQSWTAYDAARHLFVSVAGHTPQYRWASEPDPKELGPNQQIRHQGQWTFEVTTVAATREQARQFACLANVSLTPDPDYVEPPQPEPAWSGPDAMMEVTIKGDRHPCPEPWRSDTFADAFAVVKDGKAPRESRRVLCGTPERRTSRLSQWVSEGLEESLGRQKGTWRDPYVRRVAVDQDDNLYLLIASGSRASYSVDIRRISPSGAAKDLSARVAQQFSGEYFTVDPEHHVLVPGSEGGKPVIYDMAATVTPDSAAATRPGLNLDGVLPRDFLETVATDSRGNIYVTNSSGIFRITSAGVALLLVDIKAHTPVAKSGKTPSWRGPYEIVVTGGGDLLASDPTYNVIYKVTPDGDLTTFAGTSGRAGSADGVATRALFNSPHGIVLDRNDVLYVADTDNQTIRRITPDGRVSTLAGKAGKEGVADGLGSHARFESPTGIAVDSAGTLYVTSGVDTRIRKISFAGVVTTVDVRPYIDVR
jgi:hypothetical protein